MERRIILAAGHGGSSSGAQARGHSEAAECIDIVNRTADRLRADGRLEVVVVPHALDLKAEIRWVNERFGRDSGYAAEVHKNSGGPTATGVEAWHLAGSLDGARSAAIVVKELARVSRLKNRGIKKDTDSRHGTLGWLRQTNPLAGLFESGFITHDHFLNDLYAEGLFRGFLVLFELEDTATQLYRVIRTNGTQIGAFRLRENAFRAWHSVDGDALIRNREGRDVTAEIAAEHGVVLVAPDGAGDAAAAPDEEAIDMEHASDADEEPPPLEPVDEEAESLEDGLVSSPQ
jgi:N-acetylmuramoyl-L-alanine amidase